MTGGRILRMAVGFLGAWLVAASPATAQENAACPGFLPDGTTCFAGQDENGAYYWIAVPARWNRILVVHTHGGPRMSKPQPDDPLEDLERFAVTVQEGYAWAGSNYRRPGYGVRMAAEDTENLRQIAWGKLGRPRLTLLHGQSWGGNVAAKTAELYAVNGAGERVYDGVVLTSGVLGGGTRSYDFRADLRAVYQYYCRNMPRPDETPYPLWQGLPVGASMKRAELEARIDDCTGIAHPPAERTPEQKQNLADILGVIRIPARTLVSHMLWASSTFSDLVNKRLDGKNPFGNVGVVYSGSHDDAALNAGVARFSPDPEAVRRLAFDSNLTGNIVVPILTMHAKDDPTAFVELENAFRDVVQRAGNGDLLVQTFTEEHEHSKLSTPEYPALFASLVRWIEAGEKPTPTSVAAACETFAAAYRDPCLFDTGFYPQPLSARSYQRAAEP